MAMKYDEMTELYVAEALRDFLKMHDKGDLENDKPTHEKVTKN